MDRETALIKRQTNFGDYNEDTGFPQPPTFKEFDVRGMAHPLSGFEILQVPEGDRVRKLLWWYGREKLELKDIVTRKEEVFEVQTVEDWSSSGVCIEYFRSRLVKVDVER